MASTKTRASEAHSLIRFTLAVLSHAGLSVDAKLSDEEIQIIVSGWNVWRAAEPLSQQYVVDASADLINKG